MRWKTRPSTVNSLGGQRLKDGRDRADPEYDAGGDWEICSDHSPTQAWRELMFQVLSSDMASARPLPFPSSIRTVHRTSPRPLHGPSMRSSPTHSSQITARRRINCLSVLECCKLVKRSAQGKFGVLSLFSGVGGLDLALTESGP